MKNNSEIKYCVTAMIDLLGFSSHLEVGAYDLRTNIGKQAIARLQSLENAIDHMNNERHKLQQYYPDKFHIIRINDAIFLSVDLDDYLKPSVGQAVKRGVSANEISEFFTEDELMDEKTFTLSCKSRYLSAIEPLIKFIGIVSRLFAYINRQESKNFFPGAKAVVATGFRKPFFSKSIRKEDVFSANFSLSNAYIAEPQLKGPYLYLDNYILQLLSGNLYAKNIMRYSLFFSEQIMFDPFEEYEDLFYLPSRAEISKTIELSLFRKTYYFRQVNPSPLTYLQIVPEIMPFLEGKKKANIGHIFKDIFLSIKNGPSKNDIINKKLPSPYFYIIRNDIEDSIDVVPEFIEKGTSYHLEQQRKKFMKSYIYGFSK